MRLGQRKGGIVLPTAVLLSTSALTSLLLLLFVSNFLLLLFVSVIGSSSGSGYCS